jgi:hypothetical protein
MRFGENGHRGGRPPGRKNKMHRDFLADMQAEWEEGGPSSAAHCADRAAG